MATLDGVDIGILLIYAGALVAMGLFFVRRSRTAEGFMLAGRALPGWAVGLAIMSAYTSSISYIATPGKAYDANWHPLIFALALPPVTWGVCRWVVPFYRRIGLTSVYEFLEVRLGAWARLYGASAFLLYMVGRVAVILYLAGMLLAGFVSWPIEAVIVALGLVTILYTLLGGMEAVVWTDVVQSLIMVGGGVLCAAVLSAAVLSGSEPAMGAALSAGKFSFGSASFSLGSRTIWVMLIYGLSENVRNLIADQNYVQKYSAAPSVQAACRSLWISVWIYLPLTALFLYLGTALFAFYSIPAHPLDPAVTRGDQVFPYYIATQLPVGLRGVMIAAIVAAAMSTVDSALNCSATVSLVDFSRRWFGRQADDRSAVWFLRLATVGWGVLGTGFALLMIRAQSALDTWWQISGIFGGGILGVFLLALTGVRLRRWQGLTGVAASIGVILWGTFIRGEAWWQCQIDPILVGVLGTGALLLVTVLLMAGRRQDPTESKGGN